jgi:hypothetical protein
MWEFPGQNNILPGNSQDKIIFYLGIPRVLLSIMGIPKTE